MQHNNNSRVAAIDMGTNTFHILIGEKSGSDIKWVARKRCWVNLAQEGITTICQESVERIFSAMTEFRKIISEHEVEKIVAVATEGFRRASNGSVLLQKINEEYSIYPEIISGDREAELIFKGTLLLSRRTEGLDLIMDIGGGSTEFILHDFKKILWKRSFKAGVSILYNAHVSQDPLTSEEIEGLNYYLARELEPLLQACSSMDIFSLTGASGTFDVLKDMITYEENENNVTRLSTSIFYDLHEKVSCLTYELRAQIKSIPPQRVQLIPTAFYLIKYVLDNLPVKEIHVSPYAMKEGIISELL